jgi:hypothetical protein
MAPILTVENRAGQAIPLGSNTLVPIAQVWHLKLPWVQGGLIWNRPVSIVIQDGDQQEQILPIQDVTRQTIWLLFGLTLLALLANLNLYRSQSSKSKLQLKESNQ